jgi:hypothetical protein
MRLPYNKEELEAIITRHGGIVGAAEFLETTRPTVYAHMRKLGIKTRSSWKKGGTEPKPTDPEAARIEAAGRFKIAPVEYIPTKAGAVGIAQAELAAQLSEDFAALTTDEERILWLAQKGVEPRDIAAELALEKRIAQDSSYKTFFEETCARGAAQMRLELAQTIYAQAKLGQVTALREMAKAHLEAYKDAAPSTEFAGGYKAKVLELLDKIHDERHTHVRARFKFEPLETK